MLPQISLDRTGGRPLHEQLSDQLRGLVLAGTLAPGALLPASGRAAAAWEVSRNVVVMAYEQLQLEGYLDAEVGVGTWVRRSLPAHLLRPAPPSDGRWASPGSAPAVRVPATGGALAQDRVRAPEWGAGRGRVVVETPRPAVGRGRDPEPWWRGSASTLGREWSGR